MENTQLKRPSVDRTFEGMERATNPNAWREVLSIHSSDDGGHNKPSGGGRGCIFPTGSEAKSDRTVKGSEAIKSMIHVVEKDQCEDVTVRGNVAPATDTRRVTNVDRGGLLRIKPVTARIM